MVIRSLGLIIGGLFLAMLVCLPAQACFGPKLFVAVGQGAQNEVLFALVTLYVQEKTGVESTRVDLEKGGNPLDLLTGEKADLVFVLTDELVDNTAFQVDGLPPLVAGKRPQEELQFTTVLPALKKLNRLLAPEDIESLVRRVNNGESPMASVRKYLMERRWI